MSFRFHPSSCLHKHHKKGIDLWRLYMLQCVTHNAISNPCPSFVPQSFPSLYNWRFAFLICIDWMPGFCAFYSFSFVCVLIVWQCTFCIELNLFMGFFMPRSILNSSLAPFTSKILDTYSSLLSASCYIYSIHEPGTTRPPIQWPSRVCESYAKGCVGIIVHGP